MSQESLARKLEAEAQAKAINGAPRDHWKTIAEQGSTTRQPLADLIRAGHAPALLSRPIEKVDYLWDGVIPRYSANLSAGNAKIGKTWRALQFGIHVAIGRDFLGRRVHRGRVLICEEEGTIESTQNRLAQMARWMGVHAEELDLLHLVPRPRLRLYDLDNIAEFAQTLADESAAGRHIDLVLLGPLTRIAHFKEENDSGEVSRFWERLQNLAPELRTTFDISHHNRKAGGVLARTTEEAIDNIRGSTANIQEPDTITGLVRDPARLQGHLFARGRDVRRDLEKGAGGDIWMPYEIRENTMLMIPSDHQIVERPEKQAHILGWLIENPGTVHTTADILKGLRASKHRHQWAGTTENKQKAIKRDLERLLDERTPDGIPLLENGEKRGAAFTYGLTDAYYEQVCEAAGIDPDLPADVIRLHERNQEEASA